MKVRSITKLVRHTRYRILRSLAATVGPDVKFIQEYRCRRTPEHLFPMFLFVSNVLKHVGAGRDRFTAWYDQGRLVVLHVLKYHPWAGILKPSTSNLTLTRGQVSNLDDIGRGNASGLL